MKNLFKQGDDDHAADKPKKDADFLDVFTTAGDCGYDFQIGETYLVYANDEEGADYFFTSTCMRTKRISDAGDDLAYLYFYKNQPDGIVQARRIRHQRSEEPACRLTRCTSRP